MFLYSGTINPQRLPLQEIRRRGTLQLAQSHICHTVLFKALICIFKTLYIAVKQKCTSTSILFYYLLYSRGEYYFQIRSTRRLPRNL